MDISTIKQAVTLSQACELYGIPINRQGFSSCPFHSSDNTPSFKIYPNDRGFYCFGCGVGGDVIKFVMLLFNISFLQALQRLNNDFRLGLDDYTPTDNTALNQRRERLREIKRLEEEIIKLCIIHRTYHFILQGYKGGEPDALQAEAIHNIEFIKYRIEVNEDILCKLKSR